MGRQAKQDVAVAVFTGLMFLGAFVLPTTGLGFVLIGAGGAGMVVMLALALIERR
jgi:hypothetical protein